MSMSPGRVANLHRLLMEGNSVGPLFGLLVFAATFWAIPYRGTNLWGTWLLEAAERTSAWLAAPGAFGTSAIEQTWMAHAALPPMTVWMVTLLGQIWPSGGAEGATHLASSLSFALCVPFVWALGRRAGGASGGAATVFAFVFTPRMLGHATMTGFSAPATLAFVVVVYSLYRARESAAWTAAATIALAVGTLMNPVVILALGPWILLTLTERSSTATRTDQPTAGGGHLRTATFPPRLLLIVFLGLPLIPLLSVLAWADPVGRIAGYFSHFLIQPKPSLLYLGARIGAGRIPWHGPIVLTFATLPPVTAILTIVGVAGELVIRPALGTRFGAPLRARLPLRPHPEAAGPEANEAKRWAAAFLLFTLLLPWALGGPFFGPIDLLALVVPFVSVFAGCTVSRLLTAMASATVQWSVPRPVQRHRHWALVALLTLLGTLVFLGPLAETLRSHPLEEAYYSWLIGSTEGAVAKGLPRYPHGPLPLPAMNALASWGSGRSPHKVALLPKSLATERVYARYRRAGAQGRLPEVSTEDDADLVVVVHDDADPAYYDLAKDVAGSVPPEDSVVLRSGTVRLITVGAFGRVRPLELGPALEGEH